ncbi:MAG: DUF971 domain-containing protein [Planctomycetes bacterium]|nr:DUF971 domain-containing protein [Planctomycetota bacterium]
MNEYPTKLDRLGDAELLIEWSDGTRRQYRVSQLRSECPCATCRERRTAEPAKSSAIELPVLSPQEAQPLRIAAMKPVGNYAYNIEFSDGHDSGIFTFELLRELGRSADAVP